MADSITPLVKLPMDAQEYERVKQELREVARKLALLGPNLDKLQKSFAGLNAEGYLTDQQYKDAAVLRDRVTEFVALPDTAAFLDEMAALVTAFDLP